MFFGLFKEKEKIKDYTIHLSYGRKRPFTKSNVIDYMRRLGIDVKTNTKARGNNGIFFKNRIDVSNTLKDDKVLEVLVHEFAHYIHAKIDPDFNKTGGSLETLFNLDDIKEIKQELIRVTGFIDKNEKSKIFINAKNETAQKINGMQKSIQKDFPDFKRSKKFSEFEKYIKNSEAKYLLKYDSIKIKTGFFIKKEKIYSVRNIETDFPKMPKAFQTYIKLCSMQRKQGRISRRLNKMNKYYEKPTELFARFVQGYFFEREKVKIAAPITSKRFDILLEQGFYKELKDFFDIFCEF